MGYDSGEKYDDSELKYTNQPDNLILFAGSEVRCKGKESNISECNIKTENIECSHNLDVVIRCTGNKGDPTGKSQAKNLIKDYPSPSLGILSLLKFKIDCKTKGNDTRFRGDAGSVYLVSCPSNCSEQNGSLFGLGIYTLDSNICKAGIHSGIITNEKGGTFAYTKTWGQGYYVGIFRNGISSNELNYSFPVSFTVQGLNSGWLGMWKLWKENFGGIYLEQEMNVNQTEKNESKFITGNGIIKNSKNLRNNYKYSKLRNKNMITNEENLEDENISSFIQLNSYASSLIPVFEWIDTNPSDNLSNKQGKNILIKDNTMRPMKKYQFLIRLKITDFKNKKYFIFSLGGCNYFNIYIDESNNLIFGDPCNHSLHINTNINIALNDKTIIYAYYGDSVLKVIIFSEKLSKPIYKRFFKDLEIKDTSSIGIGIKSDVNDMLFYGFIDFIQVYEEEIPFSLINQILEGINNKTKILEKTVARNTIDKRSCISVCTNDPIPAISGEVPPKEAYPCKKNILIIYHFINFT